MADMALLLDAAAVGTIDQLAGFVGTPGRLARRAPGLSYRQRFGRPCAVCRRTGPRVGQDVSVTGGTTALSAEGWIKERTLGRVVDVAVGVLLAIFAGFHLWVFRTSYFRGDDWGLIVTGQRGLLEPYNDHLVISILGIYRVLVEMFGLSFTPFRVAGMVCFVAIPMAWYLTTRRQIGAPLAAVGVVAMLGVPPFEIFPANMAVYLVAVGAVVCAWALREERAGWVAAGLTFALCGASGGVAVGVACLVHCVCSRAPVARWAAVLVPLGAWGVWYSTRGASSQFQPDVDPTVREVVGYTTEIVATAFDVWRFDLLLVAGFVAAGVVLLRGGLRRGASWVAWSAALVAWSAGLARERGALATTPGVAGRYTLLALVFVLLALVPPARVRLVGRGLTTATGVVAVLVVAAIVGVLRGESDYPRTAVETAQTRCLLATGEFAAPFAGVDVAEATAVRDRYWVWPSPEEIRRECERAGLPPP